MAVVLVLTFMVFVLSFACTNSSKLAANKRILNNWNHCASTSKRSLFSMTVNLLLRISPISPVQYKYQFK